MGSHKGVYIWSTIDKMGVSVITFAGNVVLARMLMPSDFGLVAMVAIFMGLVYNMASCGMNDGIIRKSMPTERDYSTLFVYNVSAGAFFCVLMFLMARPVAAFFGHEELVGIMYAVGISCFCATVPFTLETKMRKELQMKKIAIVHVSASLSAVGLGIALAAMGYGYWGIVSCRIFLMIFQMVYFLLITRLPRFAFYWDSFKGLFGFGVHLIVAYAVNQIGRNINTFVLGRYSSSESGYYSQAQKLEEVPFGITEMIFNWSFFPILANERDESKRRVLAQNMFGDILSINMAIGALLLLLSAPGIVLLFGEKWVDSIPVFRVLIAFGVCSSVKFFVQTILKAYNKSKAIRNMTFIEVALQLGLLALLFHHGVIMVALSQVMAAVVILIAHVYFYKRIEELPMANLIKSIFRPVGMVLLPFLVTGVGYLLWAPHVSAFVNCLLIVLSYVACFVLTCEIFRPSYYVSLRMAFLKRFVGN